MYIAPTKTKVALLIDDDVYDYFVEKARSKGDAGLYRSLMNASLRDMMEYETIHRPAAEAKAQS